MKFLIRCREGLQDGNAAFRQNSLTIYFLFIMYVLCVCQRSVINNLLHYFYYAANVVFWAVDGEVHARSANIGHDGRRRPTITDIHRTSISLSR